METGFNVYITEISTANISSLKLLHKYRIMKQILLCFVLLNSLIPAVKSQSVVYYLDEEKPENTYIGNVAENSNLKAYVLNPSDLVSVNYRFLTENNPAVDYFHLNERDSSLYTSKKLDREELCEFKTVCQFALEVIARCQPSGSCYNKVTVTVVLRDINDNFPVFPKKNLNISFSEGSFTGTAVPINYAVDKDQGNYSVQNYAIEQLFPVPVSQEDQQFSIQVHQIGDISSVNIVLMKQLDREIQNNYKIRVYASDGGSPPKNGSMDVDISVTDINDNAPVFAQRTYNISVNEDIAFNTTILSVFATDPDEGLNGKVLYRLSPNQDVHIHNLFDINENTGDIKVIGSLKYEPGESYQIIVWARDQAIQPLISQAHVYVYIKDVHNNPPQINVNLLSNTDFAEILENASLNAAVAHIKVNDPDNGSNGIVNCTVNNANFKLQRFDVHEYKVVVAKNLNRESIDQHSITVTCSDSGTPSLNASAHFLVHVLDVNDNAPIFSQEVYTREIAENNDIGISILKVSATDFDSGKNAEVRYSLRTTSHGFAIDASSGVVTLNRALDRENSSKIEFEVVASDGGTPRKSSVTKVIIRINDINDNAPVFSEKEYVFSIYENLVPKSFIGFVGANDSDSGENGKVLITIKHQKNVDIPFQILDNGSLVSLISMDREVTDRYDFTLVATDKGQPPMRSSVHVTVFVLDVNDNTPVFVYPNKKNKTVEISYQTPPNTIISMLSTRDADEGQNSKVTYFMADNKMSDMFQLNSISGRIRLAKHLTLADVSTYTLGFTAQDKGSPPMSSDQTLTIIISKTQLDGSVMDDLPVSHREYFLIAVAITCVTIVLAVVIVIAIFLIRRADRLKYTKSSQNNNANKPVESKKKVSFSTPSHTRTLKPLPLFENEAREKQIYPADYSAQECIQVSLKGSPDKFDGVETGIVTFGDRKDVKMTTFSNPQASFHHKPRRNATTTSPVGSLPNHKSDGDNHSNISEEFTTSDSGRGGSEEDFNTSAVLSYSTEFEDLKSSSPRSIPYSSFRTFNNRNSALSDDVFHKDDYNRLQLPVQTMSLTDKFFNFENSDPNLYSQRRGPLSPSAETSMFSINDGSTTTSGSYVLDSDDEKHLEIVQPSRQCIV